MVTTVGLLAVADAAAATRWNPIDPRWVVLCALTLLGAVATLKMRSAPVTFSMSDTFTFTALLLVGPAPATITASLEAFTLSCLLSPGHRRAGRVLFNVAAVGMAMWVAGKVLVVFEGGQGAGSLVDDPGPLAMATAAAVGTYFLVNTWIVAIAVALEQNQPVFVIWRTHFLGLGFAYATGAYTALLLALFAPPHGLRAFLLLAPMPLVLYTSLRIWLGRINDRVTHLDTINRQYRATIEALAHAVDARDQVTHGHIRRVQTGSLRLARALGCANEGELHAIEAASLLHDLGKLAIPEHILNKPGRLTEAEYARMKEHARIGAEILDGVEFPYPVVPIVRHHHENWDGTGYPDGLSGESIPLGARILAIVDCFDALTSDRPYRPAMSHSEALAVLRDRRGTMYDPNIVDHFISLAPWGDTPAASSASASPPIRVPAASEPWSAATEHLTFVPLAGPVLAVACRTAGAPAGVVFAYIANEDALAPVATLGLASPAIRALHMRVGERLSGWVAATRREQHHSDARLDLPDLETNLRAAVSLPIIRGETLVGVMTLYGDSAGCFDGVPFETLGVLASAIAEASGRAGSAASVGQHVAP
jgi:putative nucleotidyltransferase with HDIG domain